MMSNAQETLVDSNGFMSAAEFSAVTTLLAEFSDTPEFESLAKHYDAVRAIDVTLDRLVPVKLFQETLVSLINKKSAAVPADVAQCLRRLDNYAARLANTVAMLSPTSTTVPNVMHFVWVGGSEVGLNQRDYMNIWREVLAPQGCVFNLWYDSDALLAFEMNRVILDSARVHAMESGGNLLTGASQLSQLIEDRARVLKLQMFECLNQPKWVGRADEARIDLMVRAYGKDRATLQAFRQQCLDTHLAMAGKDLRLRDVQSEFKTHLLADVYQREVAMRGNFAAASDVVRLQAGHLEGGRYSDMDYLPPLKDTLGGVDIRGFDGDARLGVLQLLLNHNTDLMPGRDSKRYKDRIGKIPAQHQQALLAFAQSKPLVQDIFATPVNSPVPLDAIRLGTGYGDQARGEMNAHFLTHPGSAMTLAYMQMIRSNYDCLMQVEQRLAAAGIASVADSRALAIIQNVVNEMQASGRFPGSQTHFSSFHLIEAIHQYFQDGIRIGARGTITLTGPRAAFQGVSKYVETHLLADQIDAVRQKLKLLEGYNVFTEEEMISGWTVNDDPETWLANEKNKWVDGKFKSRYVGNLNDLLKEQVLTFKQGWPVIDGKPVLLTSVLQQLMDDLGEPFIHAMNEKISGEIVFNKRIVLSLEMRQLIRDQSVFDLPVSVGAQPFDNVNEWFSRMAHGALTIDHISPMMRVVLGGVFGAQTLDADGFADAWRDALEMAVNTADTGVFARYTAIEKALRDHGFAAFEKGRSEKAGSIDLTARELKALTLAEPLTLKQWGLRVAQIDRVTQRDYHGRILKRAATVREQFFQAGAVSAKQMPQDLLGQVGGDPSRYCYPLALMMAAAMGEGDAGERSMVGRLSNAVLLPGDAESQLLMIALNELQDVAMSEIGTPHGTLDFADIGRLLEAQSPTRVLLLDSGNHALLVAKVMTADGPVFRFFEPNFALYGFDRLQPLEIGLRRYLNHNSGELAGLYGISASEPQFNVVELDIRAINDRVLPSNLQVGHFLRDAPITDAQTVSLWKKQAQGRTRSLSENARLGAGLRQLESRFWAAEFDDAVGLLRREHQLGREYLPLLESVKAHPDKGYTLQMVDVNAPDTIVRINSEDSRLMALSKHLQRLVKGAAGRQTGQADSDGGSRLSFAFAIQTLISEMRSREYQTGDKAAPALTIALQIQVYASYAQLGYGVANDSLQMANLVRQVVMSEQALRVRQGSMAGGVVARANTGLGVGFSLLNIGFSSYNLAHASNHEQRSRFSTQLAFDLAALGLDVTAMLAGGTVGAAAGFLAVPLLGIGIGVTAIASNLGQIRDKAEAVGEHLRKAQQAYGPRGHSCRGDVLRFEPEAVIKHLDLHNHRIDFSSQKFYPMVRGGLELPQYIASPDELHRALDIRQGMGLARSLALTDAASQAAHTVVLPCTPMAFYGYEYQVGLSGFPGLDNRTVSRLEYDASGQQRFYFTVNTPFPHILYKLLPVHQPTHIAVTLGEKTRQLVIPEFPEEWKNLLSYAFDAQSSGRRQLWLTPGLVAIDLHTRGDNEWIIHAPWANELQCRLKDEGLRIDGIQIRGTPDCIELANGEFFRIDWRTEKLHLVSVSLSDGISLESALRRLRERHSRGQVPGAYVPLYQFKLPFATEQNAPLITAYHDVVRNRQLYARNAPHFVRQGIVLGAANSRHAWFYHPDRRTIWRVGAITGTVNHRYRLAGPEGGSEIIACEMRADGIRVLQRLLEIRDGVTTTLEFHVTDWSVTLARITLSSAWDDYTPDRGTDYWRSLLARLRDSDDYADATPNMAPGIASWGPEPFIEVRCCIGDDLRDLIWLSAGDARYHRLTKDVGMGMDTVMLPRADGWAFETPLFFSQQTQTLRRGVGGGNTGPVTPGEVLERDIIKINMAGGQLMATRSDGKLFEVTRDGSLHYVGLGPDWFAQYTDWISALAETATEPQSTACALIGLSRASNTDYLGAWAIGRDFLLAEMDGGKEWLLLGRTPDGKAAWLHDKRSGQVYRQALIDADAMRTAFAGGTQLIDPRSLPPAEKVWSRWAFFEVSFDGEGLLAQTFDGVSLQLRDGLPAVAVSVNNQWFKRNGRTAEERQEDLRMLLRTVAHAPVLVIEQTSGRYQYYTPDQGRLLEVEAKRDGQWAVFLGLFDGGEPLLFDPAQEQVSRYQSTGRLDLTDSFASRSDDVLSLQANGDVEDLLAFLPDGVSKLILSYNRQTTTYRLSEDVWQRLDCIVIDRQPVARDQTSQPCTVLLDMASSERLLMSSVDGHWVLTDPDNAHSVIVRGVSAEEGAAPALQIGMKIAGENQLLTPEQWFETLSQTESERTAPALGEVVRQII
ncbi:cytotoxin mcf [Pseudomonas fluorescens]|uniref:Cytotoxin mcf n=1 Tax=Pseudomonas fluorescens TaxID=294 RepID=A0A448DY36_PSEFL|nr:cytotoxin mcf [Pseudomonas fluorescens]